MKRRKVINSGRVWKYAALFAPLIFIGVFSGKSFAGGFGHEITIGKENHHSNPGHHSTCLMPKEIKKSNAEDTLDHEMDRSEDSGHQPKTMEQALDEMRSLARSGGCPHHRGMRICLLAHREDCMAVCRLKNETHRNHSSQGGVAPQFFKLASIDARATNIMAQESSSVIQIQPIPKITRAIAPDIPPPIII